MPNIKNLHIPGHVPSRRALTPSRYAQDPQHKQNPLASFELVPETCAKNAIRKRAQQLSRALQIRKK